MTMKQFNEPQVAVVLTDGAIDGIFDWCAETVQHVKDLREMGFKTKVKIFQGEHAWPLAEHWVDQRS